jgi:hypothetical protein
VFLLGSTRCIISYLPLHLSMKRLTIHVIGRHYSMCSTSSAPEQSNNNCRKKEPSTMIIYESCLSIPTGLAAPAISWHFAALKQSSSSATTAVLDAPLPNTCWLVAIITSKVLLPLMPRLPVFFSNFETNPTKITPMVT